MLDSLIGAVGFDLAESCCPRVDSTICLEMGNEVDTLTGSPSPQHCQEACRDNRECTFFTWQTEICFLFRKCDDEDIGECDSCVSGPFSPLLSSCDDDTPSTTTIHPSTVTTETTTLPPLDCEELCGDLDDFTFVSEECCSFTFCVCGGDYQGEEECHGGEMFCPLQQKCVEDCQLDNDECCGEESTPGSMTSTTSTTTTATTATTSPPYKDTVSVAIGGIGYGLLESMEVITPSKVCSYGFPDVPATKYGAAAVFLPGGGQLPGYEAILMCGGYDNYNNLAECHAYNLRDETWSEWPSLKQARYF